MRSEDRRGEVPAEAAIADYRLDARLDAASHKIEGTARVTWRNTTSRTVDTVPFHLYMNGFRAEDTAWMQSSRGRHRRSAQKSEGAWGFIDVRSVSLERHDRLVVADDIETPTEEPIDLAWSEDAEPSTMTVSLPRPVGPGESLTLHLDFVTQLPRVVARTGYSDDFHAVGQWYPKIGVLEDEAGWQAHTFTVHDEFYADFGNYQVTLDVPEPMIVGASGIRTGEEATALGRKLLTYRAEMVHDFVWMADPDFVPIDAEFRGIRIRQLIQPERVGDAEAHLAAQIAAIESYEARYGPYPWSTLTIVHPPKGARGANGMEYPTLFTTSHQAPIPKWARGTLVDERMSGVYTTIHEFGHQYFQGLFASREHLEPWLDEGMNSFSNSLALIDRWGEDPWIARFLSQKVFLSDFERLAIRRRAFWEPVDRPASDFQRVVGNYGSTIYMRTSALMTTLRNLVGPALFDPALREYCNRARFSHPRGADLETALVEGIGERVNLAGPDQEPVTFDVRQYLHQALRTTRQVDFSVVRVTNGIKGSEAGWHRNAEGELTGGEPPAHLKSDIETLKDSALEAVVVVRRAGDFEIPVELRVDFADGSTKLLTWNGDKDIEVFSWPGRRVVTATLDPQRKLSLEWSRLDNTMHTRAAHRDDGLSRPMGDFAEALSLALLAGLGP